MSLDNRSRDPKKHQQSEKSEIGIFPMLIQTYFSLGGCSGCYKNYSNYDDNQNKRLVEGIFKSRGSLKSNTSEFYVWCANFLEKNIIFCLHKDVL